METGPAPSQRSRALPAVPASGSRGRPREVLVLENARVTSEEGLAESLIHRPRPLVPPTVPARATVSELPGANPSPGTVTNAAGRSSSSQNHAPSTLHSAVSLEQWLSQLADGARSNAGVRTDQLGSKAPERGLRGGTSSTDNTDAPSSEQGIPLTARRRDSIAYDDPMVLPTGGSARLNVRSAPESFPSESIDSAASSAPIAQPPNVELGIPGGTARP